MAKYFFRLDDISSEMDFEKFEKLINLFNQFKIKPLLAVIPDNQDKTLKRDKLNPYFWQQIKELINEGFKIGMHGYQHKYVNKNGGLLNISQRSEFAGLPYEVQLKKIKKGKEILEKNGIKTETFIAPSHSFDKNTIMALKETGFKYISDGISLWPFEKDGIIWFPQVAWKPKEFPLGIITFCLHPNSFFDKDFQRIEEFIRKENKNIVTFSWIEKWHKNQSKVKKIFFCFIDSIFRLIWYLRYNFLKLRENKIMFTLNLKIKVHAKNKNYDKKYALNYLELRKANLERDKKYFYEMFKEYNIDLTDKVVLDLAAGSGIDLKILNQFKPKLLIWHDKMIGPYKVAQEILKDLNNVIFNKKDLMDLEEYKNESIDFIICRGSLFYAGNDYYLLKNIKRILKKGGYFWGNNNTMRYYKKSLITNKENFLKRVRNQFFDWPLYKIFGIRIFAFMPVDKNRLDYLFKKLNFDIIFLKEKENIIEFLIKK